MKEHVTCDFCGAEVAYNKACIGFGIEKPISQSHFFCCEEHRSEFIVSETAKERGIPYKMREYANNGRTMLYTDGLTDDDMRSLNDGEIISCIDEDGMAVMSIIMNPFGDVKEY